MGAPIYAISRNIGRVGTGVSNASWLEIHAVGKRHGVGSKFQIANELFAARLGSLFGLPIPPHALFQLNKGTYPATWFGSIDYRLTGESLPPVDPSAVFSELPWLATGVVLFDIVIANSDRHEGNLAMDKQPGKAARLNVFDHGHSICGLEGLPRFARLRSEFGIDEGADEGANRHCLLDELTHDDHFSMWYERIQNTPYHLLTDTANDLEKAEVLSADEAGAMVNFLWGRIQQVRKIVESNKQQFSGIRVWSLI